MKSLMTWCEKGRFCDSRRELKKLAKILVGADPELLPTPENIGEPFKDQTASKIRGIAAKSSRKTTKSHPFWDPDHVHTSVTDTGGKGLWKQVITWWEHCGIRCNVINLFPLDTFCSHFKCNLNMCLRCIHSPAVQMFP